MALTREVKSPCLSAIFHHLPGFSLQLTETAAAPSPLLSSISLFLEATPTKKCSCENTFLSLCISNIQSPYRDCRPGAKVTSQSISSQSLLLPMANMRAGFGFVFVSGFLWQWWGVWIQFVLRIHCLERASQQQVPPSPFHYWGAGEFANHLCSKKTHGKC